MYISSCADSLSCPCTLLGHRSYTRAHTLHPKAQGAGEHTRLRAVTPACRAALHAAPGEARPTVRVAPSPLQYFLAAVLQLHVAARLGAGKGLKD